MALSRKRDAQGPQRLEQYPLLEAMTEFAEATELSAKIAEITVDYNQKLKQVLSKIREWTWNDPVSVTYRKLFTKSVIVDPEIGNATKIEIERDLDNRVTHQIPPGYKDSGKADKGIGDLLIWRTILEIGQTKKKSVLFVSGDQKADWWYQSDKVTLYPR
jgi:hypothetical protein